MYYNSMTAAGDTNIYKPATYLYIVIMYTVTYTRATDRCSSVHCVYIYTPNIITIITKKKKENKLI